MTDARFPERWLNDRRIMRLRGEQFKFFVVSLAWSVANRTDGHLSEDDLTAIPGGSREIAQAMVDAELWIWDFDQFRHDEPRPVPIFRIIDFEETQATRADLAALAEGRRKQREKKRRQRAAAAHVPRDVPRDTPRTGQARTGSPNTEGEGLTAADKVRTNPVVAELEEREREARAEGSPRTPSASKNDANGSTTAVHRDQHFPGESSADASVQTVTREDSHKQPCPVCKRICVVKPNGRLWVHGGHKQPCPGSEQPAMATP